MTTPVRSQTETQAHQTFLALMWALTHPGQSQTWAANAGAALDGFLAIGQALLDLETSFYTPDPELADTLARATARPLPANTARYHFYPKLETSQLRDLAQAPTGTMLYPDKGATIIIGCTLGQGAPLRLSGPGIKSETTIQVDGIPPDFWALRQEKISYPLGWDVFLVDGKRIMGLPRTTQVAIGD